MEKAPEAFRTISEVADELDVPQHVLRFWESRFREIKPMKRGGGRRYYRPDDVALLRGVRYLLYGEGYTIRGVQRILKEQGIKFVQSVWRPGAPKLAPQIEPHAGEPGAPDHVVAQDDLESDAGAPRPLGVTPAPESVGPETAPHPAQPVPQQPKYPPPAQPPPSPGLGQANVRKLRELLDELAACRRELDAALGEAV